MSRRQTAQAKRRLTPRQLEILTLIRDCQRTHGYSPTMQELADELGVTKVTVFEHVETLVSKGLLRRLPHKARSLELTSRVELPGDKSTTFPIEGYIAAGVPMEAAHDQELLDLEDLFNSRHDVYVLKVRGQSMIEDRIDDGDYVICEKRTNARQGETVVAMLEDGEVTLKRFYREGNKIRLQPANAEFKPIIVDKVEIQGVVRGVVRAF